MHAVVNQQIFLLSVHTLMKTSLNKQVFAVVIAVVVVLKPYAVVPDLKPPFALSE